MDESLPDVYLARHGETAWSLSGRHTGRTDVPLTERGEDNARRLRGRLEGITFTEVLVSRLQRARRTCELAGFAAVAKVSPDLVEWDYGDYEGQLTSDVRRERPGCQSSGGVPGTPYLSAWANSGKSGRASREQALRLMAIRQARLEPLALSVSGRKRMFNGWAAASGEKRIDFSAGVAWFGDILNVEGSLMGIGPRSVFANSVVGVRQ
jgi:phosphohistidine phosphatase SixA